MKHAARLLLSSGLLVALVGAGAAHAQTVALTGVLGDKALLVVDGGKPTSLAASDIYRGVKVISLDRKSVV